MLLLAKRHLFAAIVYGRTALASIYGYLGKRWEASSRPVKYGPTDRMWPALPDMRIKTPNRCAGLYKPPEIKDE